MSIIGSLAPIHGITKTAGESYAVQASERAAAAQARRRKDMVAERIMTGRIQGGGPNVKAYQ